MNILFRADSSSMIGTGHIMRDLVLADQFGDANVIFATQELSGNINHKIKEKNYEIEILNSSYIEELSNVIKKCSIDMIIIDHYGIDYEFEKMLKNKNHNLKIFVFDDTYEKHFCDILINHNIYADEKKYKNLVPNHCELRCGAKYTLLRDEFIEEKKKKDIAKEAIFIGMGGADSANLSQKILEVLTPLTNHKINVVTTLANPNVDSLQAFVAKYPNVELHINSHKIAYLINQSILAIVSPSVILNELFYLDTSFIAIQTADNQKYMVEFLKKNEYDVLESWEASQFQSLIRGKICKILY
ncbi:MAG: UDP-2,4-diacetamido-2,4,6-trideoxy-beta-L-altropyranose hydrolase [Sulfurovum sp.]